MFHLLVHTNARTRSRPVWPWQMIVTWCFQQKDERSTVYHTSQTPAAAPHHSAAPGSNHHKPNLVGEKSRVRRCRVTAAELAASSPNVTCNSDHGRYNTNSSSGSLASATRAAAQEVWLQVPPKFAQSRTISPCSPCFEYTNPLQMRIQSIPRADTWLAMEPP